MSSDVYENFSWIAEGFEPAEVIEMIRAEISDPEQKEPVTEDFSVALKNSESKKSFVVIKGENELRRIMAEPLEKWRVFLHGLPFRELVQIPSCQVLRRNRY